MPTQKFSPCIFASWIVRLSGQLLHWRDDIFSLLPGHTSLELSKEYWKLNFNVPCDLNELDASGFFQWTLPIQHMWPTQILKTPDFVTKTADALQNKFLSSHPGSDCKVTYPMHQGEFKSIAKSLMIELNKRKSELKHLPKETKDKSLQIFLSHKALYAACANWRHFKSKQPGGGFEGQAQTEISRAGGKIIFGLEAFGLFGSQFSPMDHFLDLGASPGGITKVLLDHGYQVTAVDRADMDSAIKSHKNLCIHQCSVQDFRSNTKSFSAVVCDMNGHFEENIEQTFRFSEQIKYGGGIFFTLKFKNLESPSQVCEGLQKLRALGQRKQLSLKLVSHSAFNRAELTCIFLKENP